MGRCLGETEVCEDPLCSLINFSVNVIFHKKPIDIKNLIEIWHQVLPFSIYNGI